jgi:hypothetical protein
MRIDPRAWAAVLLAVLALWLAAPREDALLIPQRRRGFLEWLRYRLSRPQRDAQEERDATRFLAAVRDADPPVYRIRQRDLPSVNRRIDTMLLAEDVQQPWEAAPYAPDPEGESQERAQDSAQEQAQEEPQERAQEEPQKPLPELRAWSPGDPGPTPTGVLQKITPEVERQLRPYLKGLPRYGDEPRQ